MRHFLVFRKVFDLRRSFDYWMLGGSGAVWFWLYIFKVICNYGRSQILIVIWFSFHWHSASMQNFSIIQHLENQTVITLYLFYLFLKGQQFTYQVFIPKKINLACLLNKYLHLCITKTQSTQTKRTNYKVAGVPKNNKN